MEESDNHGYSALPVPGSNMLPGAFVTDLIPLFVFHWLVELPVSGADTGIHGRQAFARGVYRPLG